MTTGLTEYEELSPSDKQAFATDSLLINNAEGTMRHSRLGIEVSIETFDRVHEWYRNQPSRPRWWG